MAKKTNWNKILNSPIKPIKLDSTELLLLAFATVGLIIFFMWQTGNLGPFGAVMGISTAR